MSLVFDPSIYLSRGDSAEAIKSIGVDDTFGGGKIVLMDAQDRAKHFCDLYREVYLRFHRRDPVDAYRLSQESHGVLRHLFDTGPLTVMEAARHFERSQSSVSELIARLEARDLLARQPDERDRRRTLVWLTPLGREVLEKTEQVLSTRLLEHAFEQLPPEEAAVIVDALDRLLATERDQRGLKDE